MTKFTISISYGMLCANMNFEQDLYAVISVCVNAIEFSAWKKDITYQANTCA